MRDLAGKVIGIVLAVILVIIMPFINISVENEMLNRRFIVDDVKGFIDEVIDSRTITEGMLNELNVKLASYGMTVDYEIKRYVRKVDADPLASGKAYVSYVPVNNCKEFKQGDKISVHFWVAAPSTNASIARRLSGVVIKDLDRTITARIR